MIFDLDDTLIETSKNLTFHAHKRALERMVQEGLPVKDFPTTFQKLLEINEKAISSKAALMDFFQLFSPANPEILKQGLNALLEPVPDHLALAPVPGALDLLDFLYPTHTLFVVTIGNRELQLQKMKKAGIQLEQFSKLIVGKGPSKKADYQKIFIEHGTTPDEVVVCGDRVSIDLTPARELGFFTVHLENGRGKYHKEPKEHVDLFIHQLIDLKEIIERRAVERK